MREVFVTFDGVKVFRGYNASWKGGDGIEQKYCVVCEEEIKVGEKVSLLMCNGVLFPNIWVHDKHFSGDEQQHVNMIRSFARRYNVFMHYWNTRKIWGDL